MDITKLELLMHYNKRLKEYITEDDINEYYEKHKYVSQTASINLDEAKINIKSSEMKFENKTILVNYNDDDSIKCITISLSDKTITMIYKYDEETGFLLNINELIDNKSKSLTLFKPYKNNTDVRVDTIVFLEYACIEYYNNKGKLYKIEYQKRSMNSYISQKTGVVTLEYAMREPTDDEMKNIKAFNSFHNVTSIKAMNFLKNGIIFKEILKMYNEYNELVYKFITNMDGDKMKMTKLIYQSVLGKNVVVSKCIDVFTNDMAETQEHLANIQYTNRQVPYRVSILPNADDSLHDYVDELMKV